MARILLINDEPDLLEMCQVVLEAAGHSVLTSLAPSRPSDLFAAAHWKPDVILLDLVMPRMNGEQVFRRLRKMHETAVVPVVVMSALDGSEERAEELGADGFLAKPFDPEALTDAIATALDNRENGQSHPPRAPVKTQRL